MVNCSTTVPVRHVSAVVCVVFSWYTYVYQIHRIRRKDITLTALWAGGYRYLPTQWYCQKKNRTLFVRAHYGTYTYPFYNIRNTTCNSLSGKVNTQPQETTFTKKARVFGVYTYCKCNPCITSCLNVDCTYTHRILFRCLLVV